MIIVDDRLALDALAGRSVAHDGPAAITWGFHYRLVRALSDEGRVGSLTRASAPGLLAVACAPPSSRLVVLDPRELTQTAARLAVKHGLNLLAAELVAAAKVHSLPVLLARGNVGRSWPEIFKAEGLVLRKGR